MKILVTGGAGRLGRAVVELLHTQNNHDVIAADVIGENVLPLDLTDWVATTDFVRQHRPDVIIHTAAWTDVDGGAREPDKAVLANGFGAQHVALAAAQVGAAVVQISSNEVFPGDATAPYREYDAARPVNPYGYSKWVGEQAVQRATPRHYIVRTAWLFAHGGKNFIQSILNAANAGKPLRVVVDEVANPTYNDDLAAALCALIETERFGIYHFVNEGACSRYEFARYALDHTGFADLPIEAITHDQWERPSTPPLYAPMVNHAGQTVGITLRSWQAAVDAFLAREGLAKN